MKNPSQGPASQNKEPASQSSEIEDRNEAYRGWIFTIPNIICFVRMVGSVAMLGLAYLQLPYWFVAAFILLTVSDWIDGYLARHLHQRSDLGARIDSLADFLLYSALLFGALLLRHEQLSAEWVWLVLAVASYALTCAVGWLKFRKIPSYHTWAAKKSQFVVLVASIVLILGWAIWPVRLASLAVILTNLEATAISIVSERWQADVSSLWSVLHRQRSAKRS